MLRTMLRTKKDVDRRYKVIKKLAKGHYGVLYKVKDTKTGEIKAMKIMNIKSPRSFAGELQMVKDEVELVNSIPDKTHVVKYYDYFGVKDVGTNDIYIIMDYIEGRDLYHFVECLTTVKYKLGDYETYLFMKTCMKILDMLHSKGIAHRDIKLENYMFGEDIGLKLIDFGFSCYIKLCKGNFGTSIYRSPELKEAYKNSSAYPTKYALSGDIWAQGICFVEIINAKMMEYATEYEEYIGKTGIFQKIIEGMLDKDPNKRSTAKKVLKQLEKVGKKIKKKKIHLDF